MNFDNLNISGECVYARRDGILLLSAIIKIVTPEIAKEMLKHNPHNRNISKEAVQKYASDIREGRWEITGDSITFDTNGTLKNGQHRLMAIIETGQPLLSIIATADGNIYDIGRQRSTGDIITLGDNAELKRICSTRIIGAANVIINMTKNANKNKASKPETIEFISQNIDVFGWLRDSAISTKCITGISSAGVLAAIATAYRCGYPDDKITRFNNVLTTGYMSSDEDKSIIALRNYLIDPKNERQGSSGQKNRYMRTQYTLHAYEIGSKSTRCMNTDTVYYAWKDKK